MIFFLFHLKVGFFLNFKKKKKSIFKNEKVQRGAGKQTLLQPYHQGDLKNFKIKQEKILEYFETLDPKHNFQFVFRVVMKKT